MEAMLSRQAGDGSLRPEAHTLRALRHPQVRGMDMTTEPSSPHRPGRPFLRGLLDLRPSIGLERAMAPGARPANELTLGASRARACSGRLVVMVPFAGRCRGPGHLATWAWHDVQPRHRTPRERE